MSTTSQRSGPPVLAHVRQKAKEDLAAERVPEQQLLLRGRRFVHLYLAGLILATVAFAALALLTRQRNALLQIDRPITQAVQSVTWSRYDWVLTHASDFGYPPGDTLSYALVCIGLVAAGRRPEAALAVASSLLAGLVGGAIKQVVGRLRPSGTGIHIVNHVGGYSFPSGHVTEYTTLFGFAFYIVLTAWRGGLLRALVLAILGLLILLVGPSRIYLGAHWPSDVLGAYLFAGVWLAGTVELHLLLKSRIEHTLRRRS